MVITDKLCPAGLLVICLYGGVVAPLSSVERLRMTCLLSGGGSVSAHLPLSYADYAAFLLVMRGVFLSNVRIDSSTVRSCSQAVPYAPASEWLAVVGLLPVFCCPLQWQAGLRRYMNVSPCWFVLRLRQLHMELHISASSFLALSRPQWPMETTWYVRFLASVCISLITMA